MKQLHLYKRVALALCCVVFGSALSYAQTPITTTYRWTPNGNAPAGDTWNPTEVPNSNGSVYHIGNEVNPDWNYQVNFNNGNYPTYDNHNTERDAFKFTTGAGKGTVKVYYRDGYTENREILKESTLNLASGNNDNGNSCYGNAIRFNANTLYNIPMPYTRDVQPTSVTVQISGYSTRIRVGLAYNSDANDNNAGITDWSDWTAESSGGSTTITLNVPSEHQNLYARYISIDGETNGGFVVVSSVIVNGRSTGNSHTMPISLSLSGGNDGNGNNTGLYYPNALGFYGAIGHVWNTGMPNPRVWRPAKITVNVEYASTPVRARLKYQDYDLNDANVDYSQTHDAGSNFTLEINPADAHKGWNMGYISIQNPSGTGIVQISSVTVEYYDGETETFGQVHASLKTDQTTTVTGINDITNGNNGTKILTYNFDNADARDYYISGGRIGGLEVSFTNELAPNLVAIENDFFWYYNGGDGLGSDGYSNGNHLYRHFPTRANDSYAVAAGSEEVFVNGAALGTGSNHCYVFKSTDALGFRLKQGVTYRIKVFGLRRDDSNTIIDDFDYLYKGDNPESATLVETAWDRDPRIPDRIGVWATNCREAVYTVVGNDDLYWVRNVNGMNFAGIEILPYTTTNTVSGVNPITSNMSWWLESTDISQSQINACGDGAGPNVVKSGIKAPYVVVDGPTMAHINERVEGHQAVAMNNKDKIGIKLPAHARLKVHFQAGWTGQGLSIINANNPGDVVTVNRTVAQDGDYDYYAYYPSETGYTGSDVDLWISGSQDGFVNFAGFEVEFEDIIANPTALAAINGDYIWRGSNSVTLNADGYFDSNYLYNQGAAKSPEGALIVDGAALPAYDFSTAGNRLFFNIANDLAGEIRVYYRDASAGEETPLSTATSALNGSWTADHAVVGTDSDNRTTITFSYDNGYEGTQYPTRGWNMNGTHAYSGVTITLTDTPEKAWQILLVYADGNVGSGYTTSPSISLDIDPSRTLNAIFIQPMGIADGEDDIVYTLASATLTTAPVNGSLSGAIISNGGTDLTPVVPVNLNNRPTTVEMTVEGTSMISHLFTSSDSRNFNVRGGKIVAVEVLVDKYVDGDGNAAAQLFNGSDLISLVLPTCYWYPGKTLGRTITSADKTVLNGNRYYVDNDNKIHWVEGSDLVINDTKVENGFAENDDRTVLLDTHHAIGARLEGGRRYRITAYWDNCVGNSLRIYRDNNVDNPYQFNFTSDDPNYCIEYYTTKPAVFDLDLTSMPNIQQAMIWISGNEEEPVYFSGYKVEMIDKAYIRFDVNRDGIFTGKWQGTNDTEEHLLIYCTDNGTTENYVLPLAKYVPVYGAETDITNTALANKEEDGAEKVRGTGYYFSTKFEKPNEGTTTYPSLPNLQSTGPGSNNTTPSISGGRLIGFEDTDNDRVYRVVYRYYPEGEGAECIEDWYYVWFANYLKLGWWVNRDARLIVDTNKSQDDPDNIMVGEFYVSSGSTGNFFYDFVNPEMGYNYNYNNGRTVEGKWSYTNDKKGTSSGSRKYKADEKAMKSDKENPEDYSWTEMNDHKNHTADAIRLAFPSESDLSTYWNNGEVVKEVYFTGSRHGWPDWTAHIKFHYVRAPQVNCSVNNNAGSTTITGYGGAYTATPDGSAKIFYTTDGTAPTVAMSDNFSSSATPSATNATYTYTNGSTITSTKSTNFYATEMVYVPHPYYIYNPYTLHIEGSKFVDLMGTTNQSQWFPAMSKFAEVALNDPLVEYCDDQNERNLIRTDANGNTTTSGISVTGPGGKVVSYPFSTTGSVTYTNGRMMNVMFGEANTWAFRDTRNDNYSFKPVGVYWKIDENNDFSEHLDATLYKYKTIGDTYTNTAFNNANGLDANYTQNGNPHTECNGGLGGAGTEDGGLWLAPVAGDFIRFEPEYDGVITVWLRQNGAGQGNEEWGDITRRPVYVVDENGKVMPRSTVKPSTEHYYSLDGTYGEINSNKSTMRQDCRIDWINGLRHWKKGFKNENDPLSLRYMATFRLFNYWYGFPIYQNQNRLNHASSRNGADPNLYKWTMDIADSWISRTALVQSVICPWNSLCYHSKALHYNIEQNTNIPGEIGGAQNVTLRDQDGNQRTIYEGDKFALYGYEMPSYGTVRYRFPVKAGKSYYIGGRGTKNGFMGYKFDRLEANYNPVNYRFNDNRAINEINYNCVTISSPTSQATPSETDINNSYYHDSEHSYRARHIQIFSQAGADNPSTSADESNPNYEMKDLTDTELNLSGRGSMQGLTCNVSLWRGFEANKWYSVVLPFSISESRMKEIFGDKVQVLYLDPYNNSMSHDKYSAYKSAATPAVSYNKLRLTYHKYQMLYANVPALICPSQPVGQINGNGALQIPRVTIDKTNLGMNSYKSGSNEIAKGYDFETVRFGNTDYSINGIGYKIGEVGDWEYWITGTYNFEGAGHGEMYFLHGEMINDKYEATFYHSTAGVDIQPTRCWIEPRPKPGTSGQGAPPRLTEITFESFMPDEMMGDPAGIQDVIMDDYKVERYNDGCVYDLLGRKVAEGSTEGLTPGVYIFNGEKIYIR